jgi:hypothetical protein
MNFPEEFLAEAEKMPPKLRKLLEEELTAGNEIVEVGHSFPAPPAGAYFKLERPGVTRHRESGEGLDFYDRDTPYYSGEFTDTKRFFFVLEPPRKASEIDTKTTRNTETTARAVPEIEKSSGVPN